MDNKLKFIVNSKINFKRLPNETKKATINKMLKVKANQQKLQESAQPFVRTKRFGIRL